MKVIRYIILAFLYLNTFTIRAQAVPPPVQWEKSFGGTGSNEAHCINLTSDGGYIVAGFSNSTDGDVAGNHGKEDYWIIKLTAAGTMEWQKSFGGSNTDEATAVQQTPDGGYIVAGNSMSTDGDVTGHHGGNPNVDDCWIIKLSSSGALEWQKSLGGSLFDMASAIRCTPDGGYVLAGVSNSSDGDLLNNNGQNDGWVVKLSSTGTIQWQGSYGGTGDDIFYDIQLTADGGYVLAGESYSGPNNHGLDDYWIVKLNGNGVLEWEKRYGGSSNDDAFSIKQAADGGYIVAGSSFSFNGNKTVGYGFNDVWVLKLNTDGTLEWQKTYGGSSSDPGFSIGLEADGGYVIGASSASTDIDLTKAIVGMDYWIFRIDPNGKLLWQKSLGGSQYELLANVIPTPDKGYIMAGVSYSTDGDIEDHKGIDNSDYWIVKLGPEPTPLRLVDFSGTEKEGQSLLHWVTAYEQDLLIFDIECSSDGIHFSLIGSVKPAGNSNTNQSYSFINSQPPAGTSYYRLKIIGQGNEVRYSNTIRLIQKENNNIEIPGITAIGSEVNIKHPKTKDNACLKLLDIQGRLVKYLAVPPGTAETKLKLNVPAGAYKLVYISNDQSSTGSIVVW